MPIQGHYEGIWASPMMVGAVRSSIKHVQKILYLLSKSISGLIYCTKSLQPPLLCLFWHTPPPVWMYLMDGPLWYCRERASHAVMTKLGGLPFSTQGKGEYVARTIVSNIAPGQLDKNEYIRGRHYIICNVPLTNHLCQHYGGKEPNHLRPVFSYHKLS